MQCLGTRLSNFHPLCYTISSFQDIQPFVIFPIYFYFKFQIATSFFYKTWTIATKSNSALYSFPHGSQ